MQSLNTVPEIGIVWYAGAAEKTAFSAVTNQATKAFIDDKQQLLDDFAWWRGDWAAVQRKKDGITLDAAGLSPLIRTLGKLLPPQTRSSNDQAWLDNTRNPQLSTAAAFGIIVARRTLCQNSLDTYVHFTVRRSYRGGIGLTGVFVR
jgi:hypothetical protein